MGRPGPAEAEVAGRKETAGSATWWSLKRPCFRTATRPPLTRRFRRCWVVLRLQPWSRAALLSLAVGDEVPTYFLNGLTEFHAGNKWGVPATGNCFGSADCVS